CSRARASEPTGRARINRGEGRNSRGREPRTHRHSKGTFQEGLGTELVIFLCGWLSAPFGPEPDAGGSEPHHHSRAGEPLLLHEMTGLDVNWPARTCFLPRPVLSLCRMIIEAPVR